MSVLLTDDAREVAYQIQGYGVDEALEGFLRYHATEGREALLGQVRQALYNVLEGDGSGDAEAVVTALFGAPLSTPACCYCGGSPGRYTCPESDRGAFSCTNYLGRTGGSTPIPDPADGPLPPPKQPSPYAGRRRTFRCPCTAGVNAGVDGYVCPRCKGTGRAPVED